MPREVMAARGAGGQLSRLEENVQEEERTLCGICEHFNAAAAQLTPLRILAAVALCICVREIYRCTK